ncbi:MAG TPA: hypothetical protein VFA35_07450 [Burkholderiaceae bacterium]|nr:hypothetical protein [Burkholderiaceae bacterium]
MTLVLLIAQLGAQAHAYSHLASAADGTQHHFRTLPCLECNSFAPLLTLAGGLAPPPALAVADPTFERTPPAIANRSASICRAYRSRAPPVLS